MGRYGKRPSYHGCVGAQCQDLENIGPRTDAAVYEDGILRADGSADFRKHFGSRRRILKMPAAVGGYDNGSSAGPLCGKCPFRRHYTFYDQLQSAFFHECTKILFGLGDTLVPVLFQGGESCRIHVHCHILRACLTKRKSLLQGIGKLPGLYGGDHPSFASGKQGEKADKEVLIRRISGKTNDSLFPAGFQHHFIEFEILHVSVIIKCHAAQGRGHQRKGKRLIQDPDGKVRIFCCIQSVHIDLNGLQVFPADGEAPPVSVSADTRELSFAGDTVAVRTDSAVRRHYRARVLK